LIEEKEGQMGKRADSKALAGAERVGVSAATGSRIDNAPELQLVTTPKRQAILAGMLEAVGAEGYEHTSVRTVLDRTGVYRQAFYDNFADKDECYLHAYDMGVERVEALVVAAAAAEPSWVGKLCAGLGALLDFLDAEPDVGRALLVEVHAAGPEALAKRAAAMARINLFLDQAREAGGDSESPPPIAGEGIAAGIHAVIHSRLATGSSDGFRQLLPEFMYFAVLPYFGAERASAEMQAAAPSPG
jgi:AcrR family transcriptional regulator